MEVSASLSVILVFGNSLQHPRVLMRGSPPLGTGDTEPILERVLEPEARAW